MSMRLQPTASVRCETLGAVTGTSLMTSLTSGAAVAGSWVSLGTTSFDYHLIQLTAGYHSAATDMLVDIGIDTGGNVATIVADFKNSRRLARALQQTACLPLYIPAGSALVARTTGSANTETIGVQIVGFSRGINGAPGLPRCHALYTPSTRRGVSLTPGFGSKSSYVQLTSSTPGAIREMFVAFDCAADVARADNYCLFDIATGGSGSEQIILKNLGWSEAVTPNVMGIWAWGPFPVDIPSGTRLAVRAGVDGSGTAQPVGVSAWGLGP